MEGRAEGEAYLVEAEAHLPLKAEASSPPLEEEAYYPLVAEYLGFQLVLVPREVLASLKV